MADDQPNETEETKSEPKEEVDQTPTAPEAEVSENQSPRPTDRVSKTGKFKDLWHKYLAKKKLTFPLTALVLLALILAVPLTRYQVLGLFIKRQFSVEITDSKTNEPITNALVNLRGQTVETDNQGKATVTVKVGNGQLTVTKKYYTDYSQKVLVPLSKAKDSFKIQMQATGRLVPVTVVNKITGKGVENVSIKASDTEAKTDKNGTVTVALPADKNTVAATLSADGYNEAKVTIKVTDQKVAQNKFYLVPSGKIYFLSKASGKIDVVKTNLDGSDRQTVLAGTGHEEDASTVLLASRDWKYLALLSRRSGSLAKLYLIETSTDKLSTIDEGNATFTLQGWLGDNFAYRVDRKSKQIWQPGAVAVKSYNTVTKTTSVVDETQATGTALNYAAQSIDWINTIGSDGLVYFKSWSAYYDAEFDPGFTGNFPKLSGKKTEITMVTIGTTTVKKVIKSYNINSNSGDPSSFDYLPLNSYQYSLYKPNELYFSLDNVTKTTYNELKGEQVIENSSAAKQYFDNGPLNPTFLFSPSGNETFWAESRDGKNTLFIGDKTGAGPKQIASLSPYAVYGWFTDDYLLVSKDSSELYIMSRSGGKPLKISDYHKPDQTFYGYGGGYGGN